MRFHTSILSKTYVFITEISLRTLILTLKPKGNIGQIIFWIHIVFWSINQKWLMLQFFNRTIIGWCIISSIYIRLRIEWSITQLFQRLFIFEFRLFFKSLVSLLLKITFLLFTATVFFLKELTLLLLFFIFLINLIICENISQIFTFLLLYRA